LPKFLRLFQKVSTLITNGCLFTVIISDGIGVGIVSTLMTCTDDGVCLQKTAVKDAEAKRVRFRNGTCAVLLAVALVVVPMIGLLYSNDLCLT